MRYVGLFERAHALSSTLHNMHLMQHPQGSHIKENYISAKYARYHFDILQALELKPFKLKNDTPKIPFHPHFAPLGNEGSFVKK